MTDFIGRLGDELDHAASRHARSARRPRRPPLVAAAALAVLATAAGVVGLLRGAGDLPGQTLDAGSVTALDARRFSLFRRPVTVGADAQRVADITARALSGRPGQPMRQHARPGTRVWRAGTRGTVTAWVSRVDTQVCIHVTDPSSGGADCSSLAAAAGGRHLLSLKEGTRVRQLMAVLVPDGTDEVRLRDAAGRTTRLPVVDNVAFGDATGARRLIAVVDGRVLRRGL